MSLQNRSKNKKNARSGHPLAGMGGDPGDDPRDQNSGGGKRVDEDRDIRAPPVPAAFGSDRDANGPAGPRP
jgi:hypothetical protein